MERLDVPVFISLIRTVILYIGITICFRLMGKRQVGELQSSELVITMLISELAAIPMQEIGIPLLSGLVPILTLVVCEILVSVLMMKSRFFRRAVCGRPTVLIREGRLDRQEMSRVRCTVEDLMESLRLQGVFDLDEVEFAAIETNGQISVMPKGEKSPPKAEDFGIQVKSSLFVVVLQDGHFCKQSAALCGCTIEWVEKVLKREHCTSQEVFLLTANTQKEYRLIRKTEKPPALRTARKQKKG